MGFRSSFARFTLAAAVVVSAGGCDLLNNSNQPSPVEGAAVHYDAVGASDTIGYGGSSPCGLFVTPTCTSGSGYVQQIFRRFESGGREVTLQNLGVPGAVLSPETQAFLDARGGCAVGGFNICRNVMVDEAPYVRRTSTLVTIFIGANDANALLREVRSGQIGVSDSAFIQSQVSKFARDMEAVVATVRGRSTEARIVALNLPNMANTPYASGLPGSEKRALQEMTVGFSAGINALVSRGVTVVDLMCDGNFYNPAYFSGDGFHPNDAGYSYLTDAVYGAVSTSSAPPPRTNCSFMTMF